MNRNHANVAVAASDPSFADQAAALAKQLALPLAEMEGGYAALLLLGAEGLGLKALASGEGLVRVNFAAGAMSYRRRHNGSRKEAIARAVGIKAGKLPSILDCTAGLGRDAFILASLGCRVQLIERSPVIAALLADGLLRAEEAGGELAAICQRLDLIVGDAQDLLKNWREPRSEVVSLDPMYPHREKSALVKKEMRTLRLVVGDDQDSEALLAAALSVAVRRVVVKRPRLAPCLAGPKPNFVVAGKNSRFDVYLVP